METDPPVCLVDRPLNEFKPGDTVLFRRSIGTGFWMEVQAEFVRIEKGLVVLKPKIVLKPCYVRKMDFSRHFPGGTVKLRPASCYLWGKSGQARWDRCHWFKDVKTSAYEHEEKRKS